MKKIFKKVGKGLLALSIVANTFMPLTIVGADPEPATYDIVFKLEEHAKKFYGLSDNGAQNAILYKISYNVLGSDLGGDILLKTDSVTPGTFDQTVSPVSAHCDSQDICTYKVETGTRVKLDYNDELIDIKKETDDDRDPYQNIETHEVINSNITLGVMEPSKYDGNPTLVWSCGNAVCYHKFTGLTGTQFIDASTIADDRDNTKIFDVHATTIGFVPTVRFAARKTAIDNGELTIDKIVGPDGIDYPPVGEPKENNAYVSYGDRAFKAIIYNEDYKGLTLGSLSDLNYYPHEWSNAFERRESYDISGTTKENPTEILALLLQNHIKIKGQAINSFVPTSIEALDVPEGSVTAGIEMNGANFDYFDIVFKSNYFDKVTFKVTDADENEYYFMVNRRTIDPYIDVNPNTGEGKIITEVFYDSSYSYTDYNVLANIVYKDGTHKLVKQSPIIYGDALIYGIIDDYEFDDEYPPDDGIPPEDRGKGIKRAKYAYSISRDELKKVDKIYINVERSSSTKEFYSGNFAGSGKGNVLDMKYWEDRL